MKEINSMSWIIIEGLDRSAKTTLAKLYANQGYEVVHFSAPDKKYYTSGYAGPSYVEDIIELLVSKSGRDVVFDRSHYGEKIWPLIYGRNALLNEEDFEIIQEIEDQNAVTRILMHDPNEVAHWQRCLDNKEPLTLNQFKQARQLYYSMADKYGFLQMTKQDLILDNPEKEIKLSDRQDDQATVNVIKRESIQHLKSLNSKNTATIQQSPEQIKLAYANAINEILSSRIVKKKGTEFDSIEDKIRTFLNSELGVLLGAQPQQANKGDTFFTKEDVLVLKTFISRIKEKNNKQKF